MKHYQIKTYQADGTYIETINPDNVLNEISFSSNINGGLGQLTIQTDYDVSKSTYIGGEFVKVRMYDENHQEGKQIYYGFISQIVRERDSSRTYYKLICLGVSSLLNKIIYTSGDYTKQPATMVTDVITYMQSYYPQLIEGNIDTSYATSQNFSRDYANCYDVVNETAKSVGYKRYVDGEGKLNYFLNGNNHILHLGYDIEKMQITDSIEGVVNYLYLERKDGTVKTYSDNDSITEYGRSEQYKMNTDLNSSTTQDTYGNTYIGENKDATRNITITLNTNYAFEDIKPGDTVSIVNTNLNISNLPINKIQYSPDKCVLTIEKIDTLRNVIS